MRVDEVFIDKVDYLQRINDYKNRSDTVRKVVEKEYRKEAYRPTQEQVVAYLNKSKEKEDGHTD